MRHIVLANESLKNVGLSSFRDADRHCRAANCDGSAQVLSKIHCFGSNEAMAEFMKDPMA
jgi:hypothetical protein